MSMEATFAKCFAVGESPLELQQRYLQIVGHAAPINFAKWKQQGVDRNDLIVLSVASGVSWPFEGIVLDRLYWVQ